MSKTYEECKNCYQMHDEVERVSCSELISFTNFKASVKELVKDGVVRAYHHLYFYDGLPYCICDIHNLEVIY